MSKSIGLHFDFSTAIVPVTIQALDKYDHIDKRLYRLIIPLNSVINKDGTALYQTVAAIFTAQLNKTPVSALQIFYIW